LALRDVLVLLGATLAFNKNLQKPKTYRANTKWESLKLHLAL